MRLLLFILFPALELYLLVKVGGVIGALNMVLWVFASAVIGLWAARTQGQSAMLKVQAELAEGRIPQHNFMDGLLLFFGGVLLILPGLVTDAMGLFLLIPPFRHFAANAAGRWLLSMKARGQATGASRIFIFRGGNFPGGFGGPGPQGEGGDRNRQDGFGVHNRQDDFGVHNRQDGFGVHNRQDDSGVRNRQDGFGVRNRQDGFNGRAGEPDTFDTDAREPRQATVLESEAIDIKASSGADGAKRPDGGPDPRE